MRDSTPPQIVTWGNKEPMKAREWKKDHDDDLHTMQRKLTEIENFTV